jgi:hypothetical protein
MHSLLNLKSSPSFVYLSCQAEVVPLCLSRQTVQITTISSNSPFCKDGLIDVFKNSLEHEVVLSSLPTQKTFERQ